MALTKEEIISKATPYFLKNGYKGTGMNQLLEQLEMSKGGFYHHFKSKEELAVKIAQSLYENQFQQIEIIIYGSGSFKEKIEQLIKVYQSSLTMMRYENSINICLYMVEMMKQSEEISSGLEEIYSSLLMAMKDAFQKGINEGELQKCMDIESAGIHFIGLMEGLLFFQSVYKGSILKYIDQIFQQFYNGIKA